MKTYIGVLFFGLILFFGCDQPNSKKTNSDSNQTVTQEGSSSTQVISGTDSEAVINTDNVAVPSTPVKTALGVNPPHGQPGHDCAIPVGGPLNNSSPVVIPSTSTPVKTPLGMNPPHGQPGHDCAITVGAPLKN